MSKPIEAKAVVTLTLEINVGSRWGDTCAVRQLHDQAASEALGMIRNLKPETAEAFARAVRVVGEPKVHVVTSALA